MCNLQNLVQRNFIKNSRNVILDLVFSSDHNSQVSLASETLISPETHHPPLSMEIIVASQKKTQPEYIPNLRGCNVPAVYNWVSSQIYPSVNPNNVDDYFSSFCQTLCNVKESNCPRKRIGPGKFPCWFSRDLIQLVIRKKTVHKLTLDPHF